MPTKRTLLRRIAEVERRNQELVDARDKAVDHAGTGDFNTKRLAKQLSELREENDELRRRLDARAMPVAQDASAEERSRLRQRLALAERARVSLTAQLATVQLANDAMDRAAKEVSPA